jgi:hypothetical protein
MKYVEAMKKITGSNVRPTILRDSIASFALKFVSRMFLPPFLTGKYNILRRMEIR